MSYTVYKFIHLVGLAAVVLALGGAMVGNRVSGGKPENSRRLIALTHGVGLFIMLLGGFGMLARLGIHWPWPWWIVVKFGLWIALGAWLTLSYRKFGKSSLSWVAVLLIVGAAAGVVLFRNSFG